MDLARDGYRSPNDLDYGHDGLLPSFHPVAVTAVIRVPQPITDGWNGRGRTQPEILLM